MAPSPQRADAKVATSLARHLAFSPVPFAVTHGPAHVLRYANTAFRNLQSAGEIAIGRPVVRADAPSTDLSPVLDRAFRESQPVRDEVLRPATNAPARWSCTVWPISGDGLMIAVRDATAAEGARSRQRAIAERLLLGALREQDEARELRDASRRATFLATASRRLAMSLDQRETRRIVRRCALPRKGSWCIVDLVQANGAIHRLPVVHTDPAKRVLARTLADLPLVNADDRAGTAEVPRAHTADPVVLTHEAGDALIAAAHGPATVATLRAIGFDSLLVVPLVVRATALGTITFVTREGDAPLTPGEIELAADLADRCAMALDHARLYHESNELRAAADLANRAKSAFLGNMSHELRTPLNAIGGYADLMAMGMRGPVTTEQQADLKRVKYNQQHLLTLITEILNFAHAASGRIEYNFTDVAVDATLTHVAEMLGGTIRERELTLDCRLSGTERLVWADPDRLRQILANLVMNAVKYSAIGGGIITLSSIETRTDVMIRVADTGRGIPAEELEAIFEPFVQLTSHLSDRQGGVGLGLPISRDLARAMDGDLTVESRVGVGSTFTLTLPIGRGESLRLAPG